MKIKRIARVVLSVAAFLAFITMAGVGVGRAAVPQGAHVVKSACHNSWYANADEQALLPMQVEAGFLFDGPSLVHHLLAAPVSLAVAPLNGTFTATLSAGVMPLFKMETTAPYSTINKTAAGKFWSSKIASGLGSQSQPVDTLAALSALAPYTADTKIYSFGVGYANDTGNKALVKTITFGGATFDLKCLPKPSASASASASVAPSASVTVPAPTQTVPGAGGSNSLPLTGIKLWQIVVIAGALLSAGFLAIVLSRRRNKVRWQA